MKEAGFVCAFPFREGKRQKSGAVSLYSADLDKNTTQKPSSKTLGGLRWA